jgi:hypothetical protein
MFSGRCALTLRGPFYQVMIFNRLGRLFLVVVCLDPVTKTNWEGSGVEPDVKVDAKDALETAQKLAREKIRSKGEGK